MRILGFDPLDQCTLFRMPWNNRVRAMRALLQCPFRLVEAEARLSHLRIWTMTTETATRQDWLHILIKIETARSSAATTRKGG
jgi:5-carboxymethyl-2-hydroxymuconate isomerase